MRCSVVKALSTNPDNPRHAELRKDRTEEYCVLSLDLVGYVLILGL